MKILIPPSEGKSEDNRFTDLSIPNPTITKQVISEIKKANPDKLYDNNHEATHKLNLECLKKNTNYAIERYNGVVYKNLEYSTLKQNAQKYIDKHILIFSGLFGAISPKDKIPNYKLKIEKVTKLWKVQITNELEGEFIIDLLAGSQRKAIDTKKLDLFEIKFYHIKEGKKKNAGHFGKVIKGKFIRWLAENQIQASSKDELIKEIKKFNLDDYKWKSEEEAFVKII